MAIQRGPEANQETKQTPKKYTWLEVEQELERLRQERKSRPLAMHDLYDWYGRLSSPAFTQSVDYPQHFERLGTWREEVPDSSTRLVVLARAYLEYAWKARGTGLAYTVTEAGWEQFQIRVSEARRLLDAAVKLGVKDGEAYNLYLIAARAEGLSKEQARAWVDEGRKVDPTYYYIYSSMADYLLPRWHGEPGDIEQFANEIARELPGDDGADAFGHIAWCNNNYERPFSRTLFGGGYDRGQLARAAKVMAQRYPDSHELMNFAALCAFAVQDHEVAGRIEPLIGEFNEQDRMWVWKNSYDHFLSWTATDEHPGGEDRWVWGSPTGTIGISFTESPDRLWIASQFGPSAVDLIDLETGRIETSLPSPGGILSNVAFDLRRNWIVASFWNGSFQGWILWDVREGNAIPHRTSGKVRALAIDPERSQIAWAEEGRIQFLDVPTGETLREFTLPGLIVTMAYSDDGKLFTIRSDGDYAIHDATSGERKVAIPAVRIQESPDLFIKDFLGVDAQGRPWATIGGGELKQAQNLVRFDADFKRWDTLIDNIHAGGAIISSDRRLLAMREFESYPGGPTPIQIWDVSSAKHVANFPGHWNAIGKVVFSADGKQIATLGRLTDVVKIWSVEPKVPLADQ
jgi:WD40 repeat protein